MARSRRTRQSAQQSSSQNSVTNNSDKWASRQTWISLSALLFSLFAVFDTRYQAWETDRARIEKASFFSYRIGVDLGIFSSTIKLKKFSGMPEFINMGNEILKNVPSLSHGLALEVDIPKSADSKSEYALRQRVQARIHDLHGEEAERAYVLGVNLGQLIGILASQAVIQLKSQGTPSPEELDAILTLTTKNFANVNEQLTALNFNHKLAFDKTAIWKTFMLVEVLDRKLVEAWDPRDSRWKRNISIE